MTFPNVWGKIGETVDRMADNAALAGAQSAGGTMYIEPDKVDEVAAFFRHEAQAMRDRSGDIFDLGMIEPPGTDPVSTKAATALGQVAQGGPAAYMENYEKLAELFDNVAANLTGTAKQVRTTDDDSAASLS